MFNYSTRKLEFHFLLLCLFFGFIIVSTHYFLDFDVLYILAASIVSYLLLFFFVHSHLTKPLRLICKEVSALLAGGGYNKIKFSRKDEFGLLAYFFNEITSNVENISKYLKEGDRMASELALASDIQKSVLPREIPVIPKLDTVAKTRSADEVGGDSFDINFKGDEYYIYLGDVTGHGAPAGLIMMMVNTLFDIFLPTSTDTRDLAVKINNTLKPRVNSSMFMTASFFRWNPTNESLFYTGAGHEHILIFRAAEAVVESIPAGGIALAMAEDVSSILSEKQLVLSDQDIIVLYSDGITEAVNASGELYGLDRLVNSLSKCGFYADSLRVFEALSHDVTSFVGDAIQRDDMTLIVMRYCKSGFVSESPQSLVSTKWYE